MADPKHIPPTSESGRWLPPDEIEEAAVSDVDVLLSRAADGEITAEEEQLLREYVEKDPSKLSGLRKAIKLSKDLDEVLGDLDLAEGMPKQELPKLKPTAPTFELIPYLRWWTLAATVLFWLGMGTFRFLMFFTGHVPAGGVVPPYSERWPYMVAAWALSLCGLACVFFAGRLAAIDGKVMARLTGGGFKFSRTECLVIQVVGLALTVIGCAAWYYILLPIRPDLF